MLLIQNFAVFLSAVGIIWLTMPSRCNELQPWFTVLGPYTQEDLMFFPKLLSQNLIPIINFSFRLCHNSIFILIYIHVKFKHLCVQYVSRLDIFLRDLVPGTCWLMYAISPRIVMNIFVYRISYRIPFSNIRYINIVVQIVLGWGWLIRVVNQF